MRNIVLLATALLSEVAFSFAFAAFFPIGRALFGASSETQGQLVGTGKSLKRAKKNSGEEKSRTRRRAPGDNVLTDQFQTVRPVLASDWCQKTFVFFCPITEQQD